MGSTATLVASAISDVGSTATLNNVDLSLRRKYHQSSSGLLKCLRCVLFYTVHMYLIVFLLTFY